MTPIPLQIPITVGQLAATPRERASGEESTAAASFAATLDSLLPTAAGLDQADAANAPATPAAPVSLGKHEHEDRADGDLLAALLALGALAHVAGGEMARTPSGPAAAARPASGPAPVAQRASSVAAAVGAAPAAALLVDGSSVSAGLVGRPEHGASGGAMAPASALPQPAQPADMRASDNAAAAATRAAPVPVPVDVVSLSPTPMPDGPPALDPTGNGQAALRLMDTQPLRAPRSPVDPRQTPQPAARTAPAGLSPPSAAPVAAPVAAPLGASPVPGGDTGEQQLGAMPRDGAPHKATAAAPLREPAAADAAAAVQAAPVRPTSANRDEHEHAPDRTMPAAVPASMQPFAASGDLVQAGAAAAQLAPPVASEQWGAALSQQIVRLSQGGEVELNLNPAELGPLKVKVSLGGGQAEVTFLSDHLAVRQAIEASIPQLRSSLADSGISLGQATVGSGSGDTPSPQRQHQPAAQQPRPFQPDSPPGETSRPVAARRRDAGSAVDTFA